MKLYIVRHGQTQWNAEQRMQGWQDSDLTSKGVEDAKKLGKSLEHIKFDSIYSSPLGRAYSTAKYVRGNRNMEIIKVDSFKEMNFGKWEGMFDSEVRELYPEEHKNFWKQPHMFQTDQGENFESLIHRVNTAFEELIEKSMQSSENILLVTHTCVIKSILSVVNNHSINDFWNPPFIHATSLTVLEVNDDEIKTVMEADVSHLSHEIGDRL